MQSPHARRPSHHCDLWREHRQQIRHLPPAHGPRMQLHFLLGPHYPSYLRHTSPMSLVALHHHLHPLLPSSHHPWARTGLERWSSCSETRSTSFPISLAERERGFRFRRSFYIWFNLFCLCFLLCFHSVWVYCHSFDYVFLFSVKILFYCIPFYAC